MSGLFDKKESEQPSNEQILAEQRVQDSYANIQPQTFFQPPAPDNDFLKYRIKTDDILRDLEHKLKGETWVVDAQGRGMWVAKYVRWVNDEGISVILSAVSNYVTRKIYLSNLTTVEIRFKCNMIKKKLAIFIFNKYRHYEIDPNKRSLLIQFIMDTIHTSLTRSEGGMEAEQVSTQSQFSHVVHENKNEAQHGIFRMPWRR